MWNIYNNMVREPWTLAQLTYKWVSCSFTLIPPGVIKWCMLDVRVTGVLRHSGVGLSPFLLLSEGSAWLPLELLTALLGHRDWLWLLLFGGPFWELDNTPSFWLRSVKFWTWEMSKTWKDPNFINSCDKYQAKTKKTPFCNASHPMW